LIIRIWRTRVDEARAAEYERFARDVSWPMFRQHEGYLGVLMGREGAECVVITCWRGRADVDALAASPVYRDVVGRIRAAGFLLEDQTTDSFPAHLSDSGALPTDRPRSG
jgi:heme-degrading monooxygenase HmoA